MLCYRNGDMPTECDVLEFPTQLILPTSLSLKTHLHVSHNKPTGELWFLWCINVCFNFFFWNTVLVWIVHTCSFLCHLLLQCGPKSKQTKNQRDGSQTQRWVLMFLFRTLLHIKLNITVEIWVHALLNVVTADCISF